MDEDSKNEYINNIMKDAKREQRNVSIMDWQYSTTAPSENKFKTNCYMAQCLYEDYVKLLNEYKKTKSDDELRDILCREHFEYRRMIHDENSGDGFNGYDQYDPRGTHPHLFMFFTNRDHSAQEITQILTMMKIKWSQEENYIPPVICESEIRKYLSKEIWKK